MKILGLFGTILLTTLGCQTVAPPAEITQARDRINKAEEVDVDDLMPSAMELANHQLNESETLWEKSLERREENQAEEADVLENQAVELASSASAIANTGIEVKENVRNWDQNPKQYVQMQQQAASAGELSAQYALIVAQQREDQARLQEQAGRERVGAAEGLGEGEILESIPLAYFETAKAEVRPTDEQTIESVAKFLKENESAAVRLTGYADPRGSTEMNRELARQRAEAVAKALQENGVAEHQVQIADAVEARAEPQAAGPAEWQLERKVAATFETGVAH